ncbi:RNase-P-pop3 domain containing protein [Pyrenophora teres f. maculata]|nr:RNase-P-pop3 domain containing protein [Pyrenophora teres f. maculata]
MAPATKQNSKPVFKTASPFTETKWPEISQDDGDVILELLCNLITPLGDHRRVYTRPSKGKKRKRNTKTEQNDSTMGDTPPRPPEIGNHVLVGLNSVTRHLEALAAKTAPCTAPVANMRPASMDDSETKVLTPLSMVILTHPKPSLSPAHAHLPTLVHLATLSPTSTTPSASNVETRLIALPTAADARLASALGIPRVGALAVYQDAPGAKTLQDYVREHIGVTQCPWIDEAMSAEWKGLNVNRE